MEVAFNKVKELSRSETLKKTHNETSENKSPLPACKNTPYARDISDGFQIGFKIYRNRKELYSAIQSSMFNQGGMRH